MERFPDDRLFLDMIRLKFWVDPQESLHTFDGSQEWYIGRNYVARKKFALTLPGGSRAKLSVAEFPDGTSPQAWTAEFNPSKLVHGERYESGVTRTELADACDLALSQLHELNYPKFDLAKSVVQRLDVAIDFDLGDTPSGPIIQAMETKKRSERLTPRIDVGRGDARTLTVGPGVVKQNSKGKWSIRMYDRSSLADPTRSDGPLRVELQLERDGLKRAQVKHFADIHEADLQAVLEHYWRASGFGAHISTGSRLLDQLDAYVRTTATEPSARAATVGNTYGYVAQRDRGAGASGYSPHLRRKYEAILRDAGCSAISWDDAVAGHLDPAAGRFVTPE